MPTATQRGDRDPRPPASPRPELLGTALPSCLKAVPSSCPGPRMGKGLTGHMPLTLGQLCPVGPPEESLPGEVPEELLGSTMPPPHGGASRSTHRDLRTPHPQHTYTDRWGHTRGDSTFGSICPRQ